MNYKALVVDDEPHARLRIRKLVEADADFAEVREASNGDEAIDLIRDWSPDVVFLDIQMPQMDGFGVIETIGISKMPFVIFVTAFDHFALKAFEVRAVDYVLKPVERDRFQETLQRVKSQLGRPRSAPLEEQLGQLLHSIRPPHAYLDRFLVKSGSRAVFVRVSDLEWVESAKNYVCLHTPSETHIHRETMGAMENALDPRVFARIHRCHIIKMDAIKELRTDVGGEWEVLLRNGARLPIGRNYRDRLEGL